MKDAKCILGNTKFGIRSIAEDAKRNMVLLFSIVYPDILDEEPQPIEADNV